MPEEFDIRASAIVTDVARTTAHLADGTPGTGSTGVHEQGFRPPAPLTRLAGHLPVIAYAGGDGSAQREAARRRAVKHPATREPPDGRSSDQDALQPRTRWITAVFG